jgi:NAD(P)-dependent dehydrogenase (short-subunit alcohol dehydrogenase family)
VAVVVGGASGIGAAVAAAHRERGDTTVVWDLGDGPAIDQDCDVRVDEEVGDALSSTISSHGMPDLVTITAGVGHAGTILGSHDRREWEDVFAVNVFGVLSVVRQCGGLMMDAGRPGSIVVTTSVSGTLVDRGMGAYCASKAAADMVVRVAAAELGVHGIRVNAVAPGMTRTPMLPVDDDTPWLTAVRQRTALGRTGSADEVAEVVLAVHDLAWVTGAIVPADGGLSLHSPIDSWGARPQGVRPVG